MAETLTKTANAAKKSANIISHSGAKALQMGKGIIAARSSPTHVPKKEELQRPTDVSVHEEALKGAGEDLNSFFDVLLNAVLRPRVWQALVRRREQALR